MEIIQGDLLKLFRRGHFDVIFHGCNSRNVMGAGIAKKLRDAYPSVYEADTAHKGVRLGSMSYTEVKHGFICNLYSQDDYKGAGVKLDYGALRSSIGVMLRKFPSKDLLFGCPWIGCGLAGGDKSEVEAILRELFEGRHLTVVEF